MTKDEQIARLKEALEALYLEQVDYIKINSLGDPHHNQSMKRAREALAYTSVIPAIDFSKPLETLGGELVTYICCDVIQYRCARVCVDQNTGIVYSSPYIGLQVRNCPASSPAAADVEQQNQKEKLPAAESRSEARVVCSFKNALRARTREGKKARVVRRVMDDPSFPLGGIIEGVGTCSWDYTGMADIGHDWDLVEILECIPPSPSPAAAPKQKEEI